MFSSAARRGVMARSAGAPLPPSASLAAWYRFGRGITVTGSGVSQWDDQSGLARHLLQATDANRPPKQADGSILFNGTAHFLKTGAFVLNQPQTVYILFKQVTWTDTDTVYEGGAGNVNRLLQGTASPNLAAYGGGAGIINSSGMAVGAYTALGVAFDGANSVMTIGSTDTAASLSAVNSSAFALGADSSGASGFSNIQVKEVILYGIAHTSVQRASVLAYLRRVGGV